MNRVRLRNLGPVVRVVRHELSLATNLRRRYIDAPSRHPTFADRDVKAQENRRLEDIQTDHFEFDQVLSCSNDYRIPGHHQ